MSKQIAWSKVDIVPIPIAPAYFERVDAKPARTSGLRVRPAVSVRGCFCKVKSSATCFLLHFSRLKLQTDLYQTAYAVSTNG